MNKRKLLRRILHSCSNVRYADFVVLVEAFGFKRTRTQGSHAIYKNEVIAEMINLQNVQGEAKPYQIKQFLAIVERYNLQMGE